jgi:hypothetical protein
MPTKNRNQPRNLLYTLLTISAIFVVVIFVSSMLNIFLATQTDSTRYGGAEWLGQLGDFFGGVLNPLTALVTVILVITSIRIQSKEFSLLIKNSEEELAIFKAEKKIAELNEDIQTARDIVNNEISRSGRFIYYEYENHNINYEPFEKIDDAINHFKTKLFTTKNYGTDKTIELNYSDETIPKNRCSALQRELLDNVIIYIELLNEKLELLTSHSVQKITLREIDKMVLLCLLLSRSLEKQMPDLPYHAALIYDHIDEFYLSKSNRHQFSA